MARNEKVAAVPTESLVQGPGDTPIPPIAPATPAFNAATAQADRYTPLPRISDPPAPQAPYRLLQGADALMLIERYKLSRLHRHIFFLLDGQRDVNDLSRLTGHPFNEIRRLLYDLQRLGLVK